MTRFSGLGRACQPAATETARRPSSERPLEIHLLGGLPTDAVRHGFAWASGAMPVVPLDALVDLSLGDHAQLGIVLPPFVEPALIVESWEECDFLPYCLERPAHVAGISVFVDTDQLGDHLSSHRSLSSRGWGRGDGDGRTVADIVVGQIESATQLVLAGGIPLSDALSRCLEVLNPSATRIPLCGGVSGCPAAFLAGLGSRGRRAGDGGQSAARERPITPSAPEVRSVRVVPPWLSVLRGECDAAPGPELLVYRRTRPFDANRLAAWLADPPPEILRGKGHIWLAAEPDQAFGYSCAGAVHRLFSAGRWKASYAGTSWPGCETQRQRLLERWHPRFGDRRQELVLTGVDLDPDRVFDGLDACLAADEDFEPLFHANGRAPRPARSGRLH